jgi:hypothetical protein
MRALLVLLVAVLLVPPADAQGRLLDRAKRAVERAVSDRDREVETPPAVATPQAPPTEAAPAAVPAPAAAPASDPMPPTGPMPTTAAGIAPAMDWLHWARTLSDVRVEQEEPAVRVFPLSDQILFPVEGVTYQRVLRHADSRLVDWEEVELIVHPTLPAFGTLISDRPFGLEAHLEPGHYRAVVTANGHEIGALPFEVFRLTSGDGLYDSRATFGARGRGTTWASSISRTETSSSASGCRARRTTSPRADASWPGCTRARPYSTRRTAPASTSALRSTRGGTAGSRSPRRPARCARRP